MPEPEPRGSEGDGGEEVSCKLVIARGDASEVLELVEEAFDEVALPVEIGVDGALVFAVALCRDMRTGPVYGDDL